MTQDPRTEGNRHDPTDWDAIAQFDREHLWHPYTSATEPLPCYPVVSAHDNRLVLADGRELVDGMASWWAAIHGYNHPVLNEAIEHQLRDMAHVMFGGITHRPAVDLAHRLLDITQGFSHVFFADSGSVAVEVAIKMAMQYHQARGNTTKRSLLTVRGGYHGDTTGAMSVTDPDGGMHRLFTGILPKHYFAERPERRFGEPLRPGDCDSLQQFIHEHHQSIAAIIIEPVVQGAGGMWFYSAEYLQVIRQLCDQYDLLLIHDEIATGFGRTGQMFATEHASREHRDTSRGDVWPDIMCVGKALTGGYMTLSAVLATRDVAEGVSSDGLPLMHGPTFMANPLACAVAGASLDLLTGSDWQPNIRRIEHQLRAGLEPCHELGSVADVRVLGAIGVVEMHEPVDMVALQRLFIDHGVWIRPFGRLLYLMPPYCTPNEDLDRLTSAICSAAGMMQDN